MIDICITSGKPWNHHGKGFLQLECACESLEILVDSNSAGWGPRFCVSNELPGNTDAAGSKGVLLNNQGIKDVY